MIIDTSVLIAIFRREPDAPVLAQAIEQADGVRISAGSLFEANIVIDGLRNAATSRDFDELCAELGFTVVAFDEAQARIAREAYRKFGKGSGHKARLNFGDCFAYALAMSAGEPLLFKGHDFGQTDVASALK